MARYFDLHIHTTKGSSDSNLTPEDLILEASRIGLKGLCITEHSGPWDRHEFNKFAELHNVVLIRGMEVDTNYGHMLAFGLDKYESGFNNAATLSKAVNAQGGFLITAHPFRGIFSPPSRGRPFLYRSTTDVIPTDPKEASLHEVFKLVNAVEAGNGGTADDENEFALQVSSLLNLPSSGGSDAHSTHGIGNFVTEFETEVLNEEQFLKALKTGSFRPVSGLRTGNPKPFNQC
jgi:predicted metal-dependent phosphoesterase TrpH